jgi:hypothetical protein
LVFLELCLMYVSDISPLKTDAKRKLGHTSFSPVSTTVQCSTITTTNNRHNLKKTKTVVFLVSSIKTVKKKLKTDLFIFLLLEFKQLYPCWVLLILFTGLYLIYSIFSDFHLSKTSLSLYKYSIFEIQI